jgi:hypothetical protein
MRKTKDDIIKELRELVRRWDEDANWEYGQIGANIQYANGLVRCSKELLEFIHKSVDDTRSLDK